MPATSGYAGKMAGKAWLGKDGLHLSEDANKTLNRSYLSPSTASSYLSCPARLAMDRLLPAPPDPFGAAELGTSAHAVLEELMGYAPKERSLATAERLIVEHLPLAAERVSAVVDVFAAVHKLAPEDRTISALQAAAERTALSYMERQDLWWRVEGVLAALGTKPIGRDAVTRSASKLTGANDIVMPAADDIVRWRSTVASKLSGLWKIEDPSSAKVLHRELSVTVDVEGVPISGIIDRVDQGRYGDQGPCHVVDYKTGKPGKADKHGDQLRSYALAVAHQTGFMPYSAKAYFTAFGKVQEVDLSREAVNRTVRHMQEAWSGLQSSVASATWPTKASPLCGWCPLALICPAARSAGFAKARSDIALVGPELGVGKWDEDDVHMGSFPMSLKGERTTRQEEVTVSTQATMTELRFGTDDKAWLQTSEADGHLNPNSYSAIALFGFVDLAIETIEASGAKPTTQVVDALAQTFARIVSDAQVLLGARPSYQEGLNTRLRGSLRSALDHMAVPLGADAATWEAWHAQVVRRIVASARAVLRIWSTTELPEKPWAVLVKEATSPQATEAAA